MSGDDKEHYLAELEAGDAYPNPDPMTQDPQTFLDHLAMYPTPKERRERQQR